jgi:tetratricopeptide (TPR) repeat protein
MAQVRLPLGKVPPCPWKRIGWLGLLGIPLVGGALAIAQPEVQIRFQQVHHQTVNPLAPPYRYAFTESSNRYPRATIAREIAHYQQRVHQRSPSQPHSAFEHAALATAYLRMARLTGEASWYVLAVHMAEQSLALLPTHNTPAIAALGRIAEARHDFATALQFADQIATDPEGMALRVTCLLAMGRFAAARQAADVLVNRQLSLSAFMLQGLVQVAQGQDAAALQTFHHGLAVEESGEVTQSARMRTVLGRYYYERGQLPLARNLYQEAIAILPDFAPAQLNLAQLDWREGHPHRALQRYAQLAGSAPSPTVFAPLILRAQARIKQAQGDRPAATALWQQAETLLRQTVDAPVDGPAKGPVDQADPLAFGHRRDLARLLLERGTLADAAEAVALMRVEVAQRRDAETLDTYAWALLQAGHLSEAQKMAQSAIALGTRSAHLFDRAAEIEQRLGNSAQAATYRQQVLAIDPQFDDRARRAVGLGLGLGS